MPTVEMTSHLYRFFPELENRKITVPAGPVADVLSAVNELAPGFTDYILDERGALRQHVLVGIDNRVVTDRKKLSDHVAEDASVYIFQALTGG